MKVFKSYRKLRKVARKYWKRYAKKEVFKFDGKKYISYWTTDIWCYYIATHIEKYHKNGFIYDIENENLDNFIEKTNKLIGKKIQAGKTSGILKGIAFANNGAYYAIEEKNNNYLSLVVLINITEI